MTGDAPGVGGLWRRRAALRLAALAPLAGTLAGTLAGLARPARASPAGDGFPTRVTLYVAGPAGGGLDTLSRQLAHGLQDHLPSGTLLGRAPIGGVDGVTGANQFAAQTTLDGEAALLVPGAASLAWLAGDSRVHFDPSHWVPVLARTNPAIVVGWGASAAIRPGARVRVASGGPVSPALAAMLAAELLGADVDPVFGLAEEAAALQALAGGHVDAVLLRRPGGVDSLAAAYPELRPLFSFGVPIDQGGFRRDAVAPDVPTLLEYNAALGRPEPSGTGFDAWYCAAEAAQLRYALVLPGLTPPSAVALWRQAGEHALALDLAGSADTIYASSASGLMRALSPGGEALLYLRSWIGKRLGWQLG